MARRWSRAGLCWPAAVWIPPRLVSYCENLPLLWVCSCFSRMQPESLSFSYQVDHLWKTSSDFFLLFYIRLDFTTLHHSARIWLTIDFFVLEIRPSIHLSCCPYTPSMCAVVPLSNYSHIHPSVYLTVDSSIHPSIHSSILLATHEHIRPSIHSFM